MLCIAFGCGQCKVACPPDVSAKDENCAEKSNVTRPQERLGTLVWRVVPRFWPSPLAWVRAALRNSQQVLKPHGGHSCLWVGCHAACRLDTSVSQLKWLSLASLCFIWVCPSQPEHLFPRTFFLCNYSTVENIFCSYYNRRVLFDGCSNNQIFLAGAQSPFSYLSASFNQDSEHYTNALHFTN